MADEPDNLVLTLLRRIDEKVDRLIDGVKDLKVRVTAVEGGLAGVQRCIDRLEDRVTRIEKRFDLVGTEK